MSTMGDRRHEARRHRRDKLYRRQQQVKTGHRRGEKLRKGKEKENRCDNHFRKKTIMGRRRMDCVLI